MTEWSDIIPSTERSLPDDVHTDTNLDDGSGLLSFPRAPSSPSLGDTHDHASLTVSQEFGELEAAVYDLIGLQPPVQRQDTIE